MELTRTTRCAVLTAATLLVAQTVFAQTASFTGTGRLAAGQKIRATGVSQNGSVVVGDAVDAAGKTQAFVWTAEGGLHGIGFLDATYQESHATDVGVTSTGQIKIVGYSKNSANKDRAFLWSGDNTGTGTFEIIPLMSTGTWNQAYSLFINSEGQVLVTGDAEVIISGNARREGFYWSTGEPDCDGIGFLNGSTPDSHGRGIGVRDGVTHIAGYSNSGWSGGANSREAASWKPQTGNPDDPGGLGGDAGLTRICSGEPFQIVAGPNGIAETTALASDIQVTAVGATGLDPMTVVVSAGQDNVIKDQTDPAGDDYYIPLGSSPSGNESLYRAMSPDGRYKVGRSNNIVGNNKYWEANLRDVKNRDYSTPDNCGGTTFHWPLGFTKVSNTGQTIADNYSEAYGVSKSASPTGSRAGLVVVGSSLNVDEPAPRATRAFICLIQDGLDFWFLRHQGAEPTDYGAPAATRFKDMRNLQWLLSYDFQLDLTGWDLREALAVSDDGKWVVGWGLHAGVEEGFVAYIPGLPSKGACCHRPSLECTIEFQAACDGEWLGPDSVCTRCCPKPFADGDQDGDVDMTDFAMFQACMNTGFPSVMPAGCECWDVNSSGVIDDFDFTRAFVVCGTGPEVSADPECE